MTGWFSQFGTMMSMTSKSQDEDDEDTWVDIIILNHESVVWVVCAGLCNSARLIIKSSPSYAETPESHSSQFSQWKNNLRWTPSIPYEHWAYSSQCCLKMVATREHVCLKIVTSTIKSDVIVGPHLGCRLYIAAPFHDSNDDSTYLHLSMTAMHLATLITCTGETDLFNPLSTWLDRKSHALQHTHAWLTGTFFAAHRPALQQPHVNKHVWWLTFELQTSCCIPVQLKKCEQYIDN